MLFFLLSFASVKFNTEKIFILTMIKSSISRNRSNGTYKVSLSGLTKSHLQALTSVLGHLAPLDVEVHHYNGIELPFQHLETFCPLADVNKMCVC